MGMLRTTSMFIFLSFFLSLCSCNCIANYQSVGVWKATEIFENDKILKDKTLENIILQFNDEGNYSYEGTLNYKEEGKFNVSSNSLFLTTQSKDEKELHIESLNSKKLVLLMEDSGKTRKMIFSKTFNWRFIQHHEKGLSKKVAPFLFAYTTNVSVNLFQDYF